MNSNPAVGLLGFWMMLQLAATIALLLGGIYALYCLSRAASGLDRMASAMEEWVASQQNVSNKPSLPGVSPASLPSLSFEQRVNPAPQSTQVPVAATTQETIPRPAAEYSVPPESSS